MSVTASVCLSVCALSPPRLLEVWKHEWYHVVTNCQGHVLSPLGLPKVAKSSWRHVVRPEGPCVVTSFFKKELLLLNYLLNNGYGTLIKYVAINFANASLGALDALSKKETERTMFARKSLPS